MLTLPPEFRQKSRAFQSDITQGILAARDRMMDSAAEFLVQCDQAIERAPPGLEHLSLAGWYSTPALQRLDTLVRFAIIFCIYDHLNTAYTVQFESLDIEQHK